jgi:hypothetical protein
MLLERFRSCERGNFAVNFAIALLPILGSVGVVIDYTRAVNVKSFIQSKADGAAISGARGGPTDDPSPYLDYMRAAITERYGPHSWIDDLNVEGEWVSNTDFQITASGAIPVTFLAAVPGFPADVEIGVLAVVRVAEPKLVYGPPTVTQLDPEASDYNRISVYCFNPEEKDNRRTHGRTQMTVIADNAGTVYDYTMPDCGVGEVMSYKLHNVRGARTDPNKWDSKRAEYYDYYTDTTMAGGTEQYDLGNKDILETVLCNRESDCVPESEGGIIPEGPNRNPERTTKSCSPDKYMYYGWEDRPPGSGWTDEDYNDIRIVIGCPTVEEVGDREVRLIR